MGFRQTMRIRNWLCLGLLILISACAFKPAPTILKQAPLPEGGKICRIAVLPFINQTKFSQAEVVFARVFVSELTNSGDYQVAQEGDVRKFYQQMRVLPNKMLASEQLRAMADMLGAQVIISGTVLEMQEQNDSGPRLDPSISVVIRIIEGASGRTIWSTYNRREGVQYRQIMHFGLVNSVTSLAKHVSAEIVEAWHKEGFLKCTEQ